MIVTPPKRVCASTLTASQSWPPACHHGAVGTSKIVVSLDDLINNAVNAVIILLLPYTAFRVKGGAGCLCRSHERVDGTLTQTFGGENTIGVPPLSGGVCTPGPHMEGYVTCQRTQYTTEAPPTLDAVSLSPSLAQRGTTDEASPTPGIVPWRLGICKGP